MIKHIKIDDDTYKIIKKISKDKNIIMNQLIIKLLEFELLKEMKDNE